MTQELLLAGIVEQEDFLKFLEKDYQPLQDFRTLMLLEHQPRSLVEPDKRQNLLIFAPFNHTFDFASYTSGRVFHEHGELRWERSRSIVRLVYIGSAAYQPGVPTMRDVEQETLDHYNKTSINYFLFGKRLDKEQVARIGANAQEGDFAEVRIPRLLRYPSVGTESERVQIAVYAYVDRATGVSVAARFHDLLPFNPSQKEKSA